MRDGGQELVVIRFADGWRVIGGRGCERLYQFSVDAEEAALRYAAEAERRGGRVQVLVQGQDGRLQPLAAGAAGAFR